MKESFLVRFVLRVCIALALVIGVCAFVFWVFVYHPRVVSAEPSNGSHNASLDGSLRIHFSKPVSRRLIVPSIVPDVAGEWVYEDPLINKTLFRVLRFVPEQVLDPSTTYTLRIQGITDVFGVGDTTSYQTAFTTLGLPDVLEVIPQKGTSNVSPTAHITVKLSQSTSPEVTFAVALDPDVPVRLEETRDHRGLTIVPLQPLRQNTTYQFLLTRTFTVHSVLGSSVVRTSGPVEVYRGMFLVALPPNLVSATPEGDRVPVTSPISLTFTMPMNEGSAHGRITIVPEVPGRVSIDASGTMITFQPQETFSYDTEYTLTIPRGTETRTGGYLESDAAFTFHTIGRVKIVSHTPGDGESGIAVTNAIAVRFDQPVKTATAESRFHVSPAVSGAFAWDGATLWFRPDSSLAYGTTYTVSIDAGVEGRDGPASTSTSVFSFATEAETFTLDIPIDLQDRALSCEAAALKMALSKYNVHVSEDAIMERIGFDPTPHKNGIWGDPSIAFVGDINGKQNTTGYGVYWGPVAAAAKKWRAGSEARTGMSTTDLTHEVANGHPVIVWGVYGGGYRDSWKTTSGKIIEAWKGEHARTVIGFVGSAPTKIILDDPYAGRIFWTRAQFEQNWSAFGNAAVIVK